MRIVKQRLLEMMPDLSIFLDVDDLEDISDLDGYIERTKMVLIFCSKGYFQSKNCMRELRSCTQKGKPMIAVLDPDSSNSALSLDEVKGELIVANGNYDKWGFAGDGGPDGESCTQALFADEPIEWNRIGAFQDVTLRLIAERILSKDHGKTYLSGELIHSQVVLPPASSRGYKYHLYVSPRNAGALEFMRDVSAWLGKRQEAGEGEAHRKGGHDLSAKLGLRGHGRGPSAVGRATGSTRADNAQSGVQFTDNIDELDECEAMLCYLNAQTWTSGAKSVAFSQEIAEAMRRGIAVTLAHEMPGVGGQAARGGVAFGTCALSSQFERRIRTQWPSRTQGMRSSSRAWRTFVSSCCRDSQHHPHLLLAPCE